MRRLAASVTLLCLVVAGAQPAAASSHRPGFTERVSVSSDGDEATVPGVEPPTWTPSHSGAISPDGRYVAFVGWAPTLTPEHYEEGAITRPRVYLHDRVERATEMISLNDDGQVSPSGGSFRPTVSEGGRFVAFHSDSRLTDLPVHNSTQIYVRDREQAATEMVSVNDDGQAGDGPGTFNRANAFAPAISVDGRYVAFESRATNLVPGDTNGAMDLFVRDRVEGTTERVSVASGGAQGNAASNNAAISADGRHVAFASEATNLVPGGAQGRHVYVHDRDTGTTEIVSVASDGTHAAGGLYVGGTGPEISADGRFVAFSSDATNLVPAKSTTGFDAYVHDRETGVTERVSVSSAGAEGNGPSWAADISADGRVVAFESETSNLVPGDTNNRADVFVHDRLTGETDRVSVSWEGVQGDRHSTGGSVSADGRHVAFQSNSTNLVPGITNEEVDVFVRDRGPVIGVGEATAVPMGEVVRVLGWATYSGSLLSTVQGDAGPLTGASVVYRHELADLLVRVDVDGLDDPLSGLHVTGLRLTTPAGTWELRAARGPLLQPRFALYRCDERCSEEASLQGGHGTTGPQVRIAVPLDLLGLAAGDPITGMAAFTGLGLLETGALHAADELALPDAAVPVPRVEAEVVAADGTVEGAAAVAPTGADFLAEVDAVEDSWLRLRACLDDVCSPAKEVTLP